MWTNSYSLEQTGEFIRECRKERGMRQSEFARMIGVSHTTLFRSTKIEKFTVRRSTFIDKDSHEHFEIRTHNRMIYVMDPDSKTIDMLMRLNLPAGVDIEIKI